MDICRGPVDSQFHMQPPVPVHLLWMCSSALSLFKLPKDSSSLFSRGWHSQVAFQLDRTGLLGCVPSFSLCLLLLGLQETLVSLQLFLVLKSKCLASHQFYFDLLQPPKDPPTSGSWSPTRGCLTERQKGLETPCKLSTAPDSLPLPDLPPLW